MANTLPHVGLRINTSPTAPGTGVIATYDLAMDSPQNYNAGRMLVMMNCQDRPVAEYLVTEMISSTSTRALNTKGLGSKMAWDLTVEWQVGNPPTVGNTYENMLGTQEADGWAISNYLGIGMTGFSDGISTYVWYSPNINWNNPVEQWHRVVPSAGSFKLADGGKRGWTRRMNVTLTTAKNYLSLGARTYARRGYNYAGTGTISKDATTAVTGAGGTLFLRDFIKGDYLLSSAGVRYGRVLSVASNTAMTLDIFDTGVLAGVAYRAGQRSNSDFAVPIYSFTEFTP